MWANRKGGEGGLKEHLAPEGTQDGGAAHLKPDQSSMDQCTQLSPMLSLEGPLREVFPQSPCSVSSEGAGHGWADSSHGGQGLHCVMSLTD